MTKKKLFLPHFPSFFFSAFYFLPFPLLFFSVLHKNDVELCFFCGCCQVICTAKNNFFLFPFFLFFLSFFLFSFSFLTPSHFFVSYTKMMYRTVFFSCGCWQIIYILQKNILFFFLFPFSCFLLLCLLFPIFMLCNHSFLPLFLSCSLLPFFFPISLFFPFPFSFTFSFLLFPFFSLFLFFLPILPFPFSVFLIFPFCLFTFPFSFLLFSSIPLSFSLPFCFPPFFFPFSFSFLFIPLFSFHLFHFSSLSPFPFHFALFFSFSSSFFFSMLSPFFITSLSPQQRVFEVFQWSASSVSSFISSSHINQPISDLQIQTSPEDGDRKKKNSPKQRNINITLNFRLIWIRPDEFSHVIIQGKVPRKATGDR